jgi:hypothetical protein
VDHEVEDDVYVERAGRKDGEPVSLKKHGAAELGLDGEDGGVEALQMSGLEDSAVLFGEADEVVGFGEGGGEGLFDKEVEAGFEERGGYSMVLDGGDGDGGCVELEVGGEQGGDVGEDGDSVLGSGLGGPGGVGVDGGSEGDGLAGILQFTIDAEVVAAKGACAANSDAQDGIACYFEAPAAGFARSGSSPATALRQRP